MTKQEQNIFDLSDSKKTNTTIGNEQIVTKLMTILKK